MDQKTSCTNNKPHIQYSSNINTGQFSGSNISTFCSFYKVSNSTVASKPEARLIIIRLEGQTTSDRIICDSAKSVTWAYRQPCRGLVFSWNTRRNCWFKYHQCTNVISSKECTWFRQKKKKNSSSFPYFYLEEDSRSVWLWDCGRQCNFSLN